MYLLSMSICLVVVVIYIVTHSCEVLCKRLFLPVQLFDIKY